MQSCGLSSVLNGPLHKHPPRNVKKWQAAAGSLISEPRHYPLDIQLAPIAPIVIHDIGPLFALAAANLRKTECLEDFLKRTASEARLQRRRTPFDIGAVGYDMARRNLSAASNALQVFPNSTPHVRKTPSALPSQIEESQTKSFRYQPIP